MTIAKARPMQPAFATVAQRNGSHQAALSPLPAAAAPAAAPGTIVERKPEQRPLHGPAAVPTGPNTANTGPALAVDQATIEGPSLTILPAEAEYLHSTLEALTPREREVLIAICQGGTNEQVAERLYIALPTLRTHLMRLNQKLHTSGKSDIIRCVAAAVLQGYRTGVLTASSPAPLN